jgi:hypothetical protein
VSPGLRDQRLRIYAPSVVLTDGVPSTTYVLASTYWGRIEPPTGREVTTGQQAGHTITAVATLSHDAVVGLNDVVRDAEGVVYEVRANLPRRAAWERVLWLDSKDDAQGTYTLAVS